MSQFKMQALLLLVVYLKWTTAATSQKIIYCVFTKGSMSMTDVDPTLCTHLCYNYAEVKRGNVEIDSSDNWSNDDFAIVNKYREKHPSLKSLITLRGPQEEFVKCSEIVSNSTCWKKVAGNIINFVKSWGFDGVNLSWLFENWVAGPKEDRQNLVKVLEALRIRCDEARLVLSATVYPTEVDAVAFYDILEMSKHLHFIMLRTYSWYTVVDQQASVGAPLQARYYDDPSDKSKSVEGCTMYWLSQGIPRDKLIVGIIAAGCSFTLNDPKENDIGVPILGGGIAGPRTNKSGVLSYNEICELQKSGGWNLVFDDEHRVPYTFKGDQWIAYDNVKAVREKAEFIARLNLGGVMLTDIDGDDYKGICGEKYPLLKTLNAVLRHGDAVPEESLPVITPRPTCIQSGYFRDPHSCGLVLCVSNITSGYNGVYLECMPGNCDNPMLGKTRAESIDVNFFICGD